MEGRRTEKGENGKRNKGRKKGEMRERKERINIYIKKND